jgi:hypothetical protein
MVRSDELSQRLYLEQERAQLRGTLRTLGVHGHYCESVELECAAMMSHLASQLTQVNRALRELEAGSYGICKICGVDIDPARLQALPRATTCFECQRRLEQHAR